MLDGGWGTDAMEPSGVADADGLRTDFGLGTCILDHVIPQIERCGVGRGPLAKKYTVELARFRALLRTIGNLVYPIVWWT